MSRSLSHVIPRPGVEQNGTSPVKSATAPPLARELLRRGQPGDADAPMTGVEMQGSFTRISESLRRSIGEDGYRALLGRAIAHTQSNQPVWTVLRYAGPEIDLDVVAAVDRHGASTVAAALESLVGALFDILSDLIGAEMARNLLDYDDAHRDKHRDTQRTPDRVEP